MSIINTKTQISSSAKNYADSLIKVGNDGVMSYDDILKDLETVKEITEQSPDLVQVMQNTSISADTKNSILEEVFSNQINEKIINFLKILISKNRFKELDQIIEAYKNDFDDINNIKRVEVISAVDLTAEHKERLVQKLQNKLQKNVIVNWIQNPEIIGGLVVHIDDDVIDSSLKNKLENLSKNLSI